MATTIGLSEDIASTDFLNTFSGTFIPNQALCLVLCWTSVWELGWTMVMGAP
jgi:hypothetical protein